MYNRADEFIENLCTFVLCFLRFECFFEKLQSLIVVRESGVFRVLFGLYYVVQSAGRKLLSTNSYLFNIKRCSFYLLMSVFYLI